MRAQPFLHGPVGEEVGGERAVRGGGAPAGDALPGVLHDGQGVLGAAGEGARLVARLDHHLRQARQGEQQGVVHTVQEAFGEVGGGRVAQRQDDGRVVRGGGAALCGERQPQQRDVAVAPPDLVAEPGAVPGGVGGQVAGLGQGPADPAVPADHGGLVGDGQDGGEADPEPADRSLHRVPLGGGAQRGQRLHAGRVERGAGVGGDEDAVAQGQPEPARHTGPRGGVGGVLREFDDQPVAVAAEDEVLLRVGVLTEAGRARRPRVQHPAPQTRRPERVRAFVGRPYEHAHGDSPHRRTTKVPPIQPVGGAPSGGVRGRGRQAEGDLGAQPPGTSATHGGPQECPNSAEAWSSLTGTEPESAAGRNGNGSTRVSSITGGATRGGFGMTAASECPPHP
ncbi:hypothetical protein STENM327S_02857 [Streptomyces tendae]